MYLWASATLSHMGLSVSQLTWYFNVGTVPLKLDFDLLLTHKTVTEAFQECEISRLLMYSSAPLENMKLSA